MWGKREQAACILAIKERKRYKKLLSVSEMTIVVVYQQSHHGTTILIASKTLTHPVAGM